MSFEEIKSNSVGVWQIIPTTGPHEQFYVSEEKAWYLLESGFVVYDVEYGPGARVLRPAEPATDADTVKSWL